MLFKVTHIDPTGKCRKAMVTGRNNADAMEQMARAYGDSKSGSCVRIATKPDRLLLVKANPSTPFWSATCGL